MGSTTFTASANPFTAQNGQSLSLYVNTDNLWMTTTLNVNLGF